MQASCMANRPLMVPWSPGLRGLGSSYAPAERSVLSTMTRGTPRLYRRIQEEGPDKNPPSGALGVVGGGKAETKARMSPGSNRRSRNGEQGEAGRWGKDQGSSLGFFTGSLHTNPSVDVCPEPLPPAVTIFTQPGQFHFLKQPCSNWSCFTSSTPRFECPCSLPVYPAGGQLP